MTYCGVVSIAGRPNVGKSTLLNRLIGQKLSITAHKPQTTRHSILGIQTSGDRQVIYVDTPGIHVTGTQRLNQVLNRTASTSLHDVDVIILVVQAMVWNEDDIRAFELVSHSGVPFFIAVNKIDTVRRKEDMLPFLAKLPDHEHLQGVMLISAQKKSGLDLLEESVGKLIPQGPWQYGEDELTDRSSRFLAAEAVREQLTRLLSAELPYALSVEIETFEESPDLLRIGAVIWVDKPSQKGIVIGKGGAQLKEVGSRARGTLETLFGTKVFLQLWVRVKEGWADDERALRSLGYDDQ
ncbi:GTPase Era [Granulosicoccus sp. 3-233]|uniref:GTPase Era n=1 Tax=Granulosicoccus sp. 3-233 TaxID=3417969 RepID=UPI003D34B0B4